MATSDAIVEELFAIIGDKKDDGEEGREHKKNKKKHKKEKKHKKHRKKDRDKSPSTNKSSNEAMKGDVNIDNEGNNGEGDDEKSKEERFCDKGVERRNESREGNPAFWDSTWDAMQLQKKADKLERVGKHITSNRRRSTSPPSHKKKKESGGKSKISESKESKHNKERESSPETEEFKRLRRLRDLQELRVDKVYAENPEDPALFEWDPKAKMRRRKVVPNEEGPSSSSKNSAFKSSQLVGRAEEEGTSKRPLSREDGEIDSEEERRQHRSRSKRNSRLSYSRERSSNRRWSRSPHRSHNRHHSRGRARSRSRQRSESDWWSDSRSRSRQTSSSRQREEWGRKSWADRDYRSRSRNRTRNRSRSSPRSRLDAYRSSRSAIDKDRLLAIARRNAAKLLNSNDRMGIDRERLVAIKAGGQTIDELTDFCRELAKKGYNDDEDLNALNREDGSEETNGYRHPFEVRDRPLPSTANFIMGYGSASSRGPHLGLEMETLTPQMKNAAKTHRMLEFPVSSGNAHRVKESEEPIDEQVATVNDNQKNDLKGDESTDCVVECVKRTFNEASNEDSSNSSNVETVADTSNTQSVVDANSSLIKEESKNSTDPAPVPLTLGSIMFGGQEPRSSVLTTFQEPKADVEIKEAISKPTTYTVIEEEEKKLTVPVAENERKVWEDAATEPDKSLVKIPLPVSTASSVTEPSSLLPSVSASSFSSSKDNVFDTVDAPSQSIDSLVGSRLSAMRKLSENPTDPEALVELYDAQKQLSAWASSKNKPGLFNGHTGAKVLTKNELNTGLQAWAKQEQFTTAKRVEGGFGEFMLKKMGWQQGEGLGKNRSGEVDPLTLDIKYDKKGLMAAEEGVYKGWNTKKGNDSAFSLSVVKDLTGKHPVSALLELATKRKWGPPVFEKAFEVGPAHKKQFIFKVNVNGVDYQPSIATDNKKKAKADAATVALRQMGMLPDDPDNPL